ncbi:MAG: hypothetical protein FJ297_03910 [Planctomycetes bacterium]|nr:hypothetical protein [Planctomycetota bacterium]
MDRGLAMRRLWWKETRQLVPLAAMLVVLAAVLHLVAALAGDRLFRSESSQSIAMIAMLGMPGLFAVGAGTLLVGQEWDVRTMGWLAGLPVTGREIVKAKLAVGLAGLVVIWAVVGVYLVGAWTMGVVDTEFWHDALRAWPAHTVFLLFAATALAWRLKSSLLSLLAVVPTALLPLALVTLAMRVAPQARWSNGRDTTNVWLLAAQSVCALAAFGLAWRWGHRAFLPARTAESRQSYGADRRPSRAVWNAVPIPSPYSALFRQFAVQSRVPLAAVSGLFLVGVLVDAAVGFVGAGAAIRMVASAWLGVLVFQGDTVGRRIAFLADRGIEPRRVWSSRIAVPFVILGLLVCAALAATVPGTSWLRETRFASVRMFGSLMALAELAAFVVGQWAGQCIPSPVIALIAGPILAMAAIGFSVAAQFSLGTPWWLAAIVYLAPILATRCLTRGWMDRRFGASYWVQQSLFVSVFLILPVIPFLNAVVREPSMAGSIAREIEGVVRQFGSEAATRPSVELVLRKGVATEDTSDGSATDGAMTMNADPVAAGVTRRDSSADSASVNRVHPLPSEDPIGAELARIAEQLKSTTGPINAAGYRVTRFVWHVAIVSRAHLAANGGPVDVSAASARHYGQSIALMTELAQRLRLSPRLVEQDSADLIEIHLLFELRLSGARERIGAEQYASSVALLADTASRNAARRRAVALSWHAFQSVPPRANAPTDLGGYSIAAAPGGGLTHGVLLRRRAGMAIADLWALLGDGSESGSVERRRRINVLCGTYDVDAFEPELRVGKDAGGPDPAVGYLITRWEQPGVARHWFGNWEREAAELGGHADSP